MDKSTFIEHFETASQKAISLAQEFVVQSLPQKSKYLLFPCQSFDENPLKDDEQIYPEEELPENEYLGPYDIEQAISFLWREKKIPEWVDASVHSEDAEFTYLQLLCCGRFTALEKNFYHLEEGYPTFHVTSPPLPIGWESIEESGKFNLYWKEKLKTRDNKWWQFWK